MSIFQSRPDTYKEPTLYPSQMPVTNERYKNFRQVHFTAGDPEQFELARNSRPFEIKNIIQSAPINHWNLDISSLYHGPTSTTVTATFRYMFDKFKKGIFIQIRDGKLRVFLPFSNAHFTNEWSDRIAEIPAELRHSPSVLPVAQWYANNYLIRYENPINEGDTGHCAIKHMFEELCRVYSPPDAELFVNRRDFPLLKQDATEPYEAIFGERHSLVSHKYDTYAPILSMVSHERYADIAIPTPDDWTRICALGKDPVFFLAHKRDFGVPKDDFEQCWTRKKAVAVFRGSSTGEWGDERNLRIRLCEMTHQNARFDTGITRFNRRYRIERGSVRKGIELEYLTKPYLSLKEQSQYKYVIHAAGHVQSFRLGAELAMGSVILLIESPWKLWYESKLIPWKHYVPVRGDLSDLYERVDWCVKNDEECARIAQAARGFYERVLTRNGCLSYLNELIYKYRIAACPVLYTYPSESRFESWLNSDEELARQAGEELAISSPILSQGRCYLHLAGLERERISNRGKSIFTSKNTLICEASAHKLVKTSKLNLAHETAIGAHCVNPLLKRIPNFMYTFGYGGEGLVIEHVRGYSLLQYIKSARFLFQDWLAILKQLSLAFAVAQRECMFTHHDACPWNIILMEQQHCVDYPVSYGGVIRASGAIVAVMVDFGRSFGQNARVMSRHRQGYIPFQDCLCLLLTSAHQVIESHRLTPEQQGALMSLFDKTCGCESRYYPGARRFSDLVQFLKTAHCYSHICYSFKGAVSQQDPLVLFEAIETKSSLLTFERADSLSLTYYGKVASVYKTPRFRDALVERHAYQQLWLRIVPGGLAERFLAQAFEPRSLHARHYVHSLEITDNEGVVYTAKARQIKGILEDMLQIGGPFKLSADEAREIQHLLSQVSFKGI